MGHLHTPGRGLLLWGLTAGLLTAAPVSAEGDPERFGSVGPDAECCDFGVTVTSQATNIDGVDSELLASLDFLYKKTLGRGELVVYIEGSTRPHDDAVAARIPEANGDAGSALGSDGRGRLQISELYYRTTFAGDTATLGLVDPGGVLDLSEVANDETSQFIATPLVNNPTIGTPDYTLGAYYQLGPRSSGLGFTGMVTASNGLGDNDPPSYGELFDITEQGRGAFVALELHGDRDDTQWRTGVWLNSADHDYLDGSGHTGNNYGAYLVLSGPAGAGRWGGRLGLSNPDVAESSRFASLALIHPLGDAEGGIGVAVTGTSSRLEPDPGTRWLAEGYLKFALNEHFELTPSLQYVHNAGLDTGSAGPSGWIAGLRINFTR